VKTVNLTVFCCMLIPWKKKVQQIFKNKFPFQKRLTPFSSFFGKVKSTRKRWWSDSRCWLDCCFYTQKRFSDVPRVSCRANTIAVTVCQSQSRTRLQWTKSVTVAVTTKAKDRCTPQSQSHTVVESLYRLTNVLIRSFNVTTLGMAPWDWRLFLRKILIR